MGSPDLGSGRSGNSSRPLPREGDVFVQSTARIQHTFPRDRRCGRVRRPEGEFLNFTGVDLNLRDNRIARQQRSRLEVDEVAIAGPCRVRSGCAEDRKQNRLFACGQIQDRDLEQAEGVRHIRDPRPIRAPRRRKLGMALIGRPLDGTAVSLCAGIDIDAIHVDARLIHVGVEGQSGAVRVPRGMTVMNATASVGYEHGGAHRSGCDRDINAGQVAFEFLDVDAGVGS